MVEINKILYGNNESTKKADHILKMPRLTRDIFRRLRLEFYN